jgi:hypothetical protein
LRKALILSPRREDAKKSATNSSFSSRLCAFARESGFQIRSPNPDAKPHRSPRGQTKSGAAPTKKPALWLMIDGHSVEGPIPPGNPEMPFSRGDAEARRRGEIRNRSPEGSPVATCPHQGYGLRLPKTLILSPRREDAKKSASNSSSSSRLCAFARDQSFDFLRVSASPRENRVFRSEARTPTQSRIAARVAKEIQVSTHEKAGTVVDD